MVKKNSRFIVCLHWVAFCGFNNNAILPRLSMLRERQSAARRDDTRQIS
jgi:hypothetical protein